MSFRIRKGDKVYVNAGRDKGKTGKVLHVFPQKGRALVENINMVKKHTRKTQKNPQGGVILQELPIHLSNLSVIDPSSNKPSRIKALVGKDGSKQRISAKSKAVLA